MTTIGQNSPATPVPRTAEPSGVGEQAGVAEDRDERAERGGAERHAEQPGLGVEPRLVQHEADGEADRERDRPADRPAHERPARDALLDHLEPGEEEEEDEAEVGEEVDVGCRPPRSSSPSGPIRIPSTISSTTVGSTIRLWSLERIAPALAAARTSTSERRPAARRRGERDHAISRERGVIPHVLVNDSPGSSRSTSSPLRNAFGGQVIGSTARLRRSTSGSGSPVKSIR